MYIIQLYMRPIKGVFMALHKHRFILKYQGEIKKIKRI